MAPHDGKPRYPFTKADVITGVITAVILVIMSSWLVILLF